MSVLTQTRQSDTMNTSYVFHTSALGPDGLGRLCFCRSLEWASAQENRP